MLDHDRLDQLLSWAPQVGCLDNTAAGEFEGLRRLTKLSTAQRRRAEHLERHLDAGEVFCNCYEERRTDLLGR